MNKICMVMACNVYVLPFLYKYQSMLESVGKKADLIYWNRDGINEAMPDNIHPIPFNKRATYNDGNKSKIIGFVQFAKFVKKTIDKNKYERIAFLGTYGGTPALLSKYLSSKHKGKYWLDIRDYSYEKWKIYYKAEELAIKNSCASVISSDGYRDFLPPYEYILTHNIDNNAIEECKELPHEECDKIRMSFIGNVRYLEENKKLLSEFGNNPNFILQYYGNGSDKIQEYCENNGITNVDFYGRFDHKQTAVFYSKTDVINNVYGNSGIELTTALSNKLYFAAALNLPILVSPDTYMEKVSKEYGFGFTFDPAAPDCADKLLQFIHEFKEIKTNGCMTFIEKVREDENKFRDLFIDFVK